MADLRIARIQQLTPHFSCRALCSRMLRKEHSNFCLSAPTHRTRKRQSKLLSPAMHPLQSPRPLGEDGAQREGRSCAQIFLVIMPWSQTKTSVKLVRWSDDSVSSTGGRSSNLQQRSLLRVVDVVVHDIEANLTYLFPATSGRHAPRKRTNTCYAVVHQKRAGWQHIATL